MRLVLGIPVTAFAQKTAPSLVDTRSYIMNKSEEAVHGSPSLSFDQRNVLIEEKYGAVRHTMKVPIKDLDVATFTKAAWHPTKDGDAFPVTLQMRDVKKTIRETHTSKKDRTLNQERFESFIQFHFADDEIVKRLAKAFVNLLSYRARRDQAVD